MNRKLRSLKAFTMMETVLVMLLTALLLGMAFLAWQQVSRFAHVYGRAGGQEVEWLQLQRTLRRDFRKSDTAHDRPDGWSLRRGDTLVRYEIADTLLVRHMLDFPPDTFHCRIDAVEKRFLGQEPPQHTDAMVDEIRLRLLLRHRSYLINLKKEYDAYTLMHTKNQKSDERY